MNPVVSKAHARIAEFGVARLKRLRQRLNEVINIERKETKGLAATSGAMDDDQLESLRDELVMLGEMNDTANQLAFVGLYSLVELRLKELMRPHARSKNDLKALYMIDSLKSEAQTRFGIDLEKVRNFLAIDEIRLINNSVKHEGVVSSSLAKAFPRWKQGRPLKGLEQAFNRLSPKVAPFIEDLARKLPNPPPKAPRNPTLP